MAKVVVMVAAAEVSGDVGDDEPVVDRHFLFPTPNPCRTTTTTKSTATVLLFRHPGFLILPPPHDPVTHVPPASANASTSSLCTGFGVRVSFSLLLLLMRRYELTIPLFRTVLASPPPPPSVSSLPHWNSLNTSTHLIAAGTPTAKYTKQPDCTWSFPN